MSLQINRFEKKEVKQNVKDTQIIIHNNTTILIKDHTTDKIISLVQLTDNITKNKELADRIITTIEEYIIEAEGDAENNNG